MYFFRLFVTALVLSLLTISCKKKEDAKLPILGRVEINGTDTIYHQISDFEFVNQDSVIVSNSTYANQIYITDFFFTSCPSICPKVKKQMLRLYDRYQEESLIKFVSHTIDPKRDDVGRLKLYANNLQVDQLKWDFLTGDKDELMGIANDYFVVAYEDPDVPGGFDHSGKIILVDTNRHVRAFCEGTDPESVTNFMDDIDKILVEYED